MMWSEDCEFVIPEGITVADIVYQSRLRDQIDGAVVKPGTSQDWVDKAYVILLAKIMCQRQDSSFPPILVYHGYHYDALQDGYHRFVASRLANLPITSIWLRDIPAEGNPARMDYAHVLEWRDIRWSSFELEDEPNDEPE